MKHWSELKYASTDQILAWAEAQPWAQAMAHWHAEGDVWITWAEAHCLSLVG